MLQVDSALVEDVSSIDAVERSPGGKVVSCFHQWLVNTTGGGS